MNDLIQYIISTEESTFMPSKIESRETSKTWIPWCMFRPCLAKVSVLGFLCPVNYFFKKNYAVCNEKLMHFFKWKKRANNSLGPESENQPQFSV